MNVLALPFDAASLRALEPVLRELAARGHQVELALAAEGRPEARRLLRPLSSELPQIVEVPVRPRTGWWWPVADAARERGAGALLERLLPPDPGILKLLHRSAPDLVLVVAGGTAAVDLLKAARSLALRTVLVVREKQGDDGAAFSGILPDRLLTCPDPAVGEPHSAARRFTDVLEAAADQPVRPWRTLPGAALLRTILQPFVSGSRRRTLERHHGDMRPGVEQIERPRYAPPHGGSVEGLEPETRSATKLATDALALLAASSHPILVGPWTGSPGSELLYWIPFLRWASRAYRLAPERFVVVSRAGTRHWYGTLATRYFDLTELLGDTSDKAPEDISAAVVARLRAELGQDGLDQLDPAILCDGLLRHHWTQRSPLDHLLQHAAFEPLPVPAPGPLEEQLPDDFYAVRFEPGPWFRDSPENRALALRLLGQLTRQGSVVLLDRPEEGATERSYWLEEELSAGRFGNRLVRANGWLAGPDALEVQTRILAGSRGFVGSYGVGSLLAAFLGKPSVSFHDRTEGVPDADLAAASTVFRSFGVSFLVLTGEELSLAESLL